jgi:type II secretory pathway pseudopilin PulG
MKQHRTRKPRPVAKAGFTLVELLVVIGILIVLTTLTVTLVNVTQNEDRIRAGAAQVQSYLEGARDRAIHAGEPRGVRFLPDPNNPNVATSLIYIGEPTIYGDPENDRKRFLTPRRITENSTGNQYIVLDSPDINSRNPQDPDNSDWGNFFLRGLIVPGETILQINKQPYTFERRTINGLVRYTLTSDRGFVVNQSVQYFLHLKPSVLPNQEPRLLPRGVVIDLNSSFKERVIPSSWGSPGNYKTMDILFSPEGTVTGVEAAGGVIHLVIADQADVDLGFNVGVDQFDPDMTTDTNLGPEAPITRTTDQRIVSVRTQSGSISVHNIDPTDTNLGYNTGTFSENNKADDPFKYAARGETAQ